MLLNKFYSHYNVSVFISWTLSGRVMRFLKSLEHILVGRYLWQIWFSCYIWSTGQQEPDKEAGASVDEVARQLERQALEEKERDDDDEGKWLILILWLGGQENMTFFDQSCLFVDIIRYSWIIVDILLNWY